MSSPLGWEKGPLDTWGQGKGTPGAVLSCVTLVTTHRLGREQREKGQLPGRMPPWGLAPDPWAYVLLSRFNRVWRVQFGDSGERLCISTVVALINEVGGGGGAKISGQTEVEVGGS